MKEKSPKYIQWTRRWKEEGSGTGRKRMGWSGEQGMRRGRRSAGTGLEEVGGSAEYMRSRGRAALKRPRR